MKSFPSNVSSAVMAVALLGLEIYAAVQASTTTGTERAAWMAAVAGFLAALVALQAWRVSAATHRDLKARKREEADRGE